MAPAIQAQHLSKTLGRGARVLRDISFEVAAGTTYVLLGSSGSGKSTLVGILRSAIPPTSGQALIGGRSCTTDPMAVRRDAVFVTPTSSLFTSLSARSNVKHLLRLGGTKPSADDAAIDHSFRRVGFAERSFDTRLLALGRDGEIQTWLALALLRNVRALILEEPTQGVDQVKQRIVLEGLLECREAGMAILILTSDIAFASVAGDTIGILREGATESEHSSDDFRSQGVTDLVRHGIGLSTVHRSVRT